MVEVNHDGAVVWEFYNPELKVNRKGRIQGRAAIYRMIRYFGREISGWVSALTPAEPEFGELNDAASRA